MYLIGITLAIWITRTRWRAAGGDPALVSDVALWAVPAGIIGGRIYFDLTTPMDIPHVVRGVRGVVRRPGQLGWGRHRGSGRDMAGAPGARRRRHQPQPAAPVSI